MFIEYVMTLCDRILRRAAEENPDAIFLQNSLDENKREESTPVKEVS